MADERPLDRQHSGKLAGRLAASLATLCSVVLVAAVVVAIYGRALSFPFTRDDTAHFGMKERWERPPSKLGDHFREEFWGEGNRSGLYRPLTATTIQATVWASGLAPRPLRAGNLALLAAMAIAAAVLARRLGVSRGGALLLALALAAHPLLSETVLEVVSRSETQAAVGVLGVALLLAPRLSAPPRLLAGRADLACVSSFSWVRVLAIALAMIAALLSKEGAFAALPALWLLGWQRNETTTRLRMSVALALALLSALALRVVVLGGLVGLDSEQIAFVDNPLIAAPFATRWFTGVAILGRQLAQLVWPASLSADWSFAAILPLTGPRDPYFVAGAVAVVLLLLWLAIAWRQRAARPAELFGLLLAGSSWLLISNVLRPVGTVMAERLFTLPAVGLLLALTAALDRWWTGRGARPLVALVGVAAVAALGARSFARAGDWRDGLTLYEAAARVAPDSARVQCTLAHILRERGRVAEARPHAERAVAILPDYGKAHSELSACLAGSGAIAQGLVHLFLASRAPGATATEQLSYETARRRYLADTSANERLLAELRRYGAELCARHPDLELYAQLRDELTRLAH